MFARRLGAVCPVVLVMTFAAAAGEADVMRRFQVPAAKAIEEETAEVREALQDEMDAAVDRGDVRGIIGTLKEYARESKDAARKFALLDVGEQLAIDAHRYTLAMGVAAEKVLQFEVTEMPTRLRILSSVAGSKVVDDLVFGIEFANAASPTRFTVRISWPRSRFWLTCGR